MTEDRIELVDREYGQCTEVNPARQIRTRTLSFNNIKEKFVRFRIGLLQRKLDKKIEQALTEGYTEKNSDSKIAKYADVIARLEEKIKILSREDVPKDYVARRAIKLRQNMIGNLTYNTTKFYGSLYTVGLENRDVVMAPGIEGENTEPAEVKKPYIESVEPVIENHNYKPVIEETHDIRPVIEEPVLAAAAVPAGGEAEIDVSTDDLDRQSIVDAINSSFDVKEGAEPVLDREDVREVIDGSLENTDGEPVIDKEVVRTAVDEAFRKLEEEKDRQVIPTVEDAEQDQVKVSQNNAAAVHATQFDEDGNRIPHRKKYDYTPMTDEEIRLSQIKLGFDEHGNLIDSGKRPESEVVSRANVVGGFAPPKLEDVFVPATSELRPIREVPVVAPDRQEDALGIDLDEEASMFEIIDQGESTEENTKTSSPMTIDDYTALKEKILFLRKQKEESQQQRLDAQKRAEEADARAKEAKKMYEESQANYNERMQRLRAYAATLEAACSENEKSIEEAEQRSRESDGFVLSQQEETDRTNQIVSEIDRMMNDSGEPETTSIRVIK